MKIKVFAHTSPEAMLEAAKRAGLSDKAADFFRYLGEVEIELTVDENGAVLAGRLLNNF